MSEIFYWVLNVSIIGSLTALVVMALRRWKRIPRKVVYILWTIPLLRLWIPFGIANPLSVLSLISKFTTRTVVVMEQHPQLTVTNVIMGANSYFPIQYKTNLLEQVFEVASVVWIVIAAAGILASILLYSFTKAALKSIERISGNIYKSDSITAPAVYGILQPKIIIPASIADGDIEYIIMHERVHIRRRDNLLRVVAVITACVHWFNPLSWVFLKCFFEDMELACDAAVLKNLDKKQRKDYAGAILACASGRTFFASAFGGARTRLRIENVLSYRRLTLLSSICLGILVLALAVVLVTNAVA